MHTRKSLTDDLREAGILPSDTLLVHSSMKSIGEVEGGADAVLDALMDYFKDDGLLVFPTLSTRLNEEDPVFDVAGTRATCGLLPDMFRRRPGVLRSLHPTHSVAAWGRDAEAFTAGHERFDTPCAADSPWGRLAERHARILFIGTRTIHCNTFLHGVEEWFGVPGSLTDTRQRLVAVDRDGREHVVMSRRHAGLHSRFYEKMRPLFDQAGILGLHRFGDAECFLLSDCAAVRDIALQCLRKDPLFSTHD